jgi:heavy metal sensor kinase
LRRTLSIGAKWTLRYAAVMLVTVCVFSFYVYDRAQERIQNDARVLMKLQLSQALEFVRSHPGDVGSWSSFAERQVAGADPDLRLGLQIYGPDLKPVVEAGSAGTTHVPLPANIERWDMREVDLGHNYDFLALAGQAQGGAVQVLVYSRVFARGMARVRDAFFAAIPFLLVATAGLGYWLSRGSLRPIAAMTRTARRISAHQLDESIPSTGSGDEFDELAGTLNDMLDRVREGVERVKRFSVDAAHQLRTPITAIQNEIEVTLAKERQVGDYRATLEDLLVQVATLSDTVNGMLRLAQSEGGLDASHRSDVEIDPLLEEVVEFFGALAEEHGVELTLTGAAKAAVVGDPVWLHQLFANLIHNALKYTPEGGHVTVEAAREGRRVRVRVRDDGAGMSEADRTIAFTRFQRGSASSAGDGMGLGLALVREMTRAHGGSIDIESELGRGSVFTVWLPVAPVSEARQRPPAR